MSRIAAAIYTVVHLIMFPWIAWRHLVSGGWTEFWLRFGTQLPVVRKPSIWLHGSSVGEIALLETVVRHFERTQIDHQLIISAYTSTGLQTARSRFPQHIVIAFPFDFQVIARKFIRRLCPRLLVTVESELWPNLLTVFARANIPIALINGRMSERTYRFHRTTRFAAQALRALDLIAVQAEVHAERLLGLGVDSDRVHVTGSMKYDLAATDSLDGPSVERSIILRDRIVVIGGSLHAGEAELLLDAISQPEILSSDIVLILVPRYPNDTKKILSAIESRGLTALLWSNGGIAQLDAVATPIVLVVDTFGQLRHLYQLADIAFVGGSLFYRGSNRGGHNLMEPAIFGVPVLFGPYNVSFSDVADRLESEGGGILVRDRLTMRAALNKLISDEPQRHDMGRKARAVVIDGQGATALNTSLLDHLLEQQG